jgi:hypothetical protein
MTPIPFAAAASSTRRIQALSNAPSSGSHVLHVDSPIRITEKPAARMSRMSSSRRSLGWYSA